MDPSVPHGVASYEFEPYAVKTPLPSLLAAKAQMSQSTLHAPNQYSNSLCTVTSITTRVLESGLNSVSMKAPFGTSVYGAACCAVADKAMQNEMKNERCVFMVVSALGVTARK